MIREIKFRGYDSGRKTWIYGDLQTPINNNDIPFIRQYDKDTWFSVKEDSIGQYTGFKDKNDKEIYEGDIVFAFKRNYKCKVVWIKRDGAWGLERLDDPEIILYFLKGNNYEVIGNIYEDKLKEE